MTPTDKDMERARVIALRFETSPIKGSSMGYEWHVEQISNLIAQVRAETKNDVAEHLQKTLAGLVGCGDGNCLVDKPKGMHTNGGCRCWQDRYKAQRFMAYVQSAIRSLKNKGTQK